MAINSELERRAATVSRRMPFLRRLLPTAQAAGQKATRYQSVHTYPALAHTETEFITMADGTLAPAVGTGTLARAAGTEALQEASGTEGLQQTVGTEVFKRAVGTGSINTGG